MTTRKHHQRKKRSGVVTYIVRMDYERNHGWVVRVPETKPKYFADLKLGGQKKARAAAVAYRDKMCDQHFGRDKPRTTRRFHSYDPRTSTGIVGVQYNERVREYRGVKVDSTYTDRYYTAVWCPTLGSTSRHKRFSISKYGRKKALKLAVAYRRKMVKKLLGMATK